MTIPVPSRPHTPAIDPSGDTATQPTTTNSPSRRPSQSGEQPLKPVETYQRAGTPTMSAAEQSKRRVSLPKSGSTDSLGAQLGESSAGLFKAASRPASQELVPHEDLRKPPPLLTRQPSDEITPADDRHGPTTASKSPGQPPVDTVAATSQDLVLHSPTALAAATPASPAPIHVHLSSAAELGAHACATAEEALAHLYAPLKTMGRDAAAVDAMVAHQAAELRACGIVTKPQLDDVTSKAAFWSQWGAAPARGAVSGAGFNSSDAGFRFTEHDGKNTFGIPMTTPGGGARAGASSGFPSSVADVATSQLAQGMFKNKVHNDPSQERMHPVMQNVNLMGDWQGAGNAAKGATVGFTGRNVIREIVQVPMVMAGVNPATRAMVDKVMSSLGGEVSSMIMHMTMHHQKVKQGHAGPAQFYARTDLRDVVQHLNKPMHVAAGEFLKASGGVGMTAIENLANWDTGAMKEGLKDLLGTAASAAGAVAGAAGEMMVAQVKPPALASHSVLTAAFAIVGAIVGSAAQLQGSLDGTIRQHNPGMSDERVQTMAGRAAEALILTFAFTALAGAYAAWAYSPAVANQLKDKLGAMLGSERRASITAAEDTGDGTTPPATEGEPAGRLQDLDTAGRQQRVTGDHAA